jgi:peptidoglycan hydrolase-like protein with peptidoglycan-binding domain
MHGADVAELQEGLRFVGIIAVNSFNAQGVPDGIFGPGTAAAVVEWQNRNGLHADGIVGRQTWCTLGVR